MRIFKIFNLTWFDSCVGHSNASSSSKRTYNSVAWRMSGKFQRTYSNVAWRMSAKFQRTYIAWHEAWVESSRELTVATEKHVLPTQVRMNVITCPTPPHPCIHAPTGSHRQACPSSASSHWTSLHAPPHPTLPHPTPPMCTKHNGLLKAVVQLY